MKLSKLCLGTAQLGMNYGINNADGKPSFDEALLIVNTALDNNICVFDTAPEYGDSEKILGEITSKRDDEKTFVSKVSPANWDMSSDEIIKKVNYDVQNTINNLKIDKIPIYLFHRFNDIKQRDYLIPNELSRLKNLGLIEKIGVSIYSPDEAEEALNMDFIEVIQIPFNVIDKRLYENGFLQKAKEKNITVFARSVFLQGLFFKKEFSDHFLDYQKYHNELNNLCNEHNLSIGEVALRYVLSINEINSVLVGVEKVSQLNMNIDYMNKGPLPEYLIDKLNDLGTAPEHIVNPVLWKK